VIGRAASDALERVAQRAQDALAAFTPGAIPRETAGEPPRPQVASDPLSVAAPASAYFVTAGPDGAPRYTRDGGFHLAGRTLVAGDGSPVLGYAGGAQGMLPAPLHLDPGDVALARHTGLQIAGDGTLAYVRPAIDPRTGARFAERVVVGRVALARFPAGTVPTRIDATHAAAPAGVVPHLGVPADGAFEPLTTRARDGGGIDLDTALDRLAEAYTAFSALRAAFAARGAVDRTATELVK
jgi:hypothetical protein